MVLRPDDAAPLPPQAAPDPGDDPFPNEPTIDTPELDVPVERDVPAEPGVVRDGERA